MSAGGGAERHHRIPRRVLRAYDRMQDHPELDGEAIELFLEYEAERLLYGLPEDTSREELERAIESSVTEVSREEHRRRIHAADWSRWGRMGGLRTLERYGRAYFRLLALRRHRKLTREELRAARDRVAASDRPTLRRAA